MACKNVFSSIEYVESYSEGPINAACSRWPCRSTTADRKLLQCVHATLSQRLLGFFPAGLTTPPGEVRKNLAISLLLLSLLLLCGDISSNPGPRYPAVFARNKYLTATSTVSSATSPEDGFTKNAPVAKLQETTTGPGSALPLYTRTTQSPFPREHRTNFASCNGTAMASEISGQSSRTS